MFIYWNSEQAPKKFNLEFKLCRPLQGDTTLFEKHLQDLLLKHNVCEKEVFITRDFNINLLDFENNLKSSKLCKFNDFLWNALAINKSVRLTRYTTTKIDRIFIINTEIKSAIIKADISNHFLIINH